VDDGPPPQTAAGPVGKTGRTGLVITIQQLEGVRQKAFGVRQKAFSVKVDADKISRTHRTPGDEGRGERPEEGALPKAAPRWRLAGRPPHPPGPRLLSRGAQYLESWTYTISNACTAQCALTV
jgi:hypothetical protein